MTLSDPVQGVLDEEPAHLITQRTIEVQGRTPWGFVAVRKIRTEIPEVVALRTQMVVDHVEDNR